MSKYFETLYKENFYKQIKNIIGSPESFIKSNKTKRYAIYIKLKELSLLSEFTNSFKKDIYNKYNDLEKEKIEFQYIYEQMLCKNIERKDSANFSNQIKLMVNCVIQYAFDNGYIEKKIDANKIIKNMNPDLIFFIVLSTAVSSLQFIPSYNELKEGVEENEIEQQNFIYNLTNNFIIHIMVQILNDNLLSSNAILILYQKIPEIIHSSNDKIFKQSFFKVSHQLITLFIHSLNLEQKTVNYKNEFGQSRSIVLIKLPNEIMDKAIPSTHIPQIIEPDNNYETLEDSIRLSKNIKNGVSSIILSSKTKEGLKISQKKMFIINKETLKLFQKLDNSSYEDVKNLECLPFTPINHLLFLESQIKDLEKEVNSNLSFEISVYYKKQMGKKYDENLDDIIIQNLNINRELLTKSKTLYDIKKIYKSRMKLRILHNTIVKFAEIFEGFPIYYINSYDYRLRMYPWNYMFNRTSGIYKYFVMEKKSFIKKKDIVLMIQNYFKNHKTILNHFNLIKDNFNNLELVKWFETNSKDKIENDSFFYYYLLKKEILNLEKNKFKTGFLMEIDQKSSSSVLLSIILGDLNLAKESNLISGIEIKDANNFIMEKSKEWFKDKISEDSYKIISSERSLHKYLFMCSIYNQTNFGRIKRLNNYLTNKEDIKIISFEYPIFMNNVFPSVSIKKEKLNNIIKFYLNKSLKPIEIETLDGSILSWYIFEKDRQNNDKIKIKNPMTGFFQGVHINTLDVQSINKNKIIRGLLPSLIHSIDGAIMRLIILDIYETDNYIINHLHDSIQFHPTKYQVVLKSITKIYSSKKIENILKNRFLERLRNNLLDEHKHDFDLLVNDLYDKNFETININDQNLNIKAMFPLE